MTDLHIIAPETMELTMTWVIERIVEYAEKNGKFPDRLTTRPKNIVKILYFMNSSDLRESPRVLGIPLLMKVGDNPPVSIGA